MPKKELKLLSIAGFPLWTAGKGKGMKSQYIGHRAYVDKGWQVHLICPSMDKSLDTKVEDGIHVYPVKQLNIIKTGLPIIDHLIKKISVLIFMIRVYRYALKLADKINPTLIYGHTYLAGPAAFFVARKFSRPVIFRDYGTFLANNVNKLSTWFKSLEELLALKLPYDYLILTDDGTQYDKLAKVLRIPDAKIRFWLNGVDKEIYRPNFNIAEFKRQHNIGQDCKIVLALSRLVRWKRVERLIKAIPEVVEKYSKVVFFVVGDGPEKTKLEKIAGDLGCQNHLRFTGMLTRQDVVAYLNAQDIYISLFDFSNVGNSLLESLVCGKCTVALAAGDTNKIIANNQNGILLKQKELAKLPQIIADLLVDNQKRARLGRVALSWANTNILSWSKRMQQEISLAERLVEEYDYNKNNN